MTDRPIIFSAPMVQALLAGHKTQTRRLLKPQPHSPESVVSVSGEHWMSLEPSPVTGGTRQMDPWRKLPYAPDDRLWVREAWRSERGLDRQNATEIAAACLDSGYSRVWAPIFYEVDAERVNFENGMVAGRYRHARFMPRWASRLTLTLTEVRVQRLQDISEADAEAEGASLSPDDIADNERLRTAVLLPHIDAIYGDSRPYRTAVGNYASLWNSLHGDDAWDANPWVVALTFTVAHGNIGQLGTAT